MKTRWYGIVGYVALILPTLVGAVDLRVENLVVSVPRSSADVYVYLTNQDGVWSVEGAHSKELGGQEPFNVDAESNFERLLVDMKSGSTALFVNALVKSCDSLSSCRFVPMPNSGLSVNECNVGVGEARSLNSKSKYTFCNSSFVRCDKGAGSILKLGFTSVLGLGTGRCTARFDQAELQDLVSKPEILTAISKAASRIDAQVLDKYRKVDAQAAALAQRDQLGLEKKRESEAENERLRQSLAIMGQDIIVKRAIGEMLCADAKIDGKRTEISAFLEAVNGQKVQVRVNRVGDRYTSWPEGALISGINYRPGGIVWTDAAIWRTCQ